MTSSRYGHLEVAQDVDLYRKPFLLSLKSAARGRSIARSEKNSKNFFSSTAEVGKSSVGEFIEGIELYKMASRQSPRGLTFNARGRQIFEEVKISAGPQHFVYNFSLGMASNNWRSQHRSFQKKFKIFFLGNRSSGSLMP
jgi:hypothetical protein